LISSALTRISTFAARFAPASDAPTRVRQTTGFQSTADVDDAIELIADGAARYDLDTLNRRR
jgi:hypothetical protein